MIIDAFFVRFVDVIAHPHHHPTGRFAHLSEDLRPPRLRSTSDSHHLTTAVSLRLPWSLVRVRPGRMRWGVSGRRKWTSCFRPECVSRVITRLRFFHEIRKMLNWLRMKGFPCWISVTHLLHNGVWSVNPLGKTHYYSLYFLRTTWKQEKLYKRIDLCLFSDNYSDNRLKHIGYVFDGRVLQENEGNILGIHPQLGLLCVVFFGFVIVKQPPSWKGLRFPFIANCKEATFGFHAFQTFLSPSLQRSIGIQWKEGNPNFVQAGF